MLTLHSGLNLRSAPNSPIDLLSECYLGNHTNESRGVLTSPEAQYILRIPKSRVVGRCIF